MEQCSPNARGGWLGKCGDAAKDAAQPSGVSKDPKQAQHASRTTGGATGADLLNFEAP